MNGAIQGVMIQVGREVAKDPKKALISASGTSLAAAHVLAGVSGPVGAFATGALSAGATVGTAATAAATTVGATAATAATVGLVGTALTTTAIIVAPIALLYGCYRFIKWARS